MSNADVKKEALEIVEDLVSTFRMHDSSCTERTVKYGESCVFSGCGNCMNAMCKALKNKLAGAIYAMLKELNGAE